MNPQKQAAKKMNLYGKKGIPFAFIVDFEAKKPVVVELKDAFKKNILFDVRGNKNYQNYQNQGIKNQKIIFKKFPLKYTQYLQIFKKGLKEIKFGNSYLMNLTCMTPVKTNLTLRDIFETTSAKYKLFYKNKFTVFSPETFVEIRGSKISTFPMKGTIDNKIKNAKNILLKDKKETAEHNTVVDLLRNDLSMVAEKVRVEKFRFVDKIKTNTGELLQVSSKISGRLQKNWKEKIGDIIFTLLPAGSICGAPKKKTVEIIKRTENYKRGYYTGVFGIFDGRKLDCGVMIRFLEKKGSELYFKSGGGITIFSDPKKEYKELIDKIYVPVI